MMVKKYFLLALLVVSVVLSACASNQDNNESHSFLEDKNTVVAGSYYFAYVTDEGKIVVDFTEDRGYSEASYSDAQNIVSLVKNPNFPLAITAEGSVYVPIGERADDYQSKSMLLEQEGVSDLMLYISSENAKELSKWENVYQVFGNYPAFGMIGLQSDGTVEEFGFLDNGMSEDEVQLMESWRGVKDIAILYSGEQVAMLDASGNVQTIHMDKLEWDNIVSIETGGTMLFGLTKEGNVVCSEPGFDREYSVENMKNIVFIAAGYDDRNNIDVIYGIRNDGKVINQYGQVVEGFEDIVEMDVSTSYPNRIIARKADGTIVINDASIVGLRKI